MTIAFRPPTKTELAALERRRKFHDDIAAKAAALANPPAPVVAPAPAPHETKPAAPLPKILVYPAHVFARDVNQASNAGTPNRIREIQDLICKNLNVLRAEMLSGRRERPLVMARQIAMYLCKRHTPNSFPDIGQRFGGRDHTTVLNAVWRVEKIMAGTMGSDTSPQWKAGFSDMVRDAVNLAEVTISTWGEARASRARYPARSGR